MTDEEYDPYDPFAEEYADPDMSPSWKLSNPLTESKTELPDVPSKVGGEKRKAAELVEEDDRQSQELEIFVTPGDDRAQELEISVTPGDDRAASESVPDKLPEVEKKTVAVQSEAEKVSSFLFAET